MAGTTPFDYIVADLDYPLFVVSAAVGEDADACLVGFTSQCSIEPRRFAVFLSKKNHTYEVARGASVLIVHRVRAEQHELAEHFGGTSEKDDLAKLAEWPWRAGPDGAPVIQDCDWFAGRIEGTFDAGDHVGFLLAPFAGEHRGQRQLGYQEARDIEAGQPAGEPD
jgi:flavin reductase (DIM6/NTAB) family NADH-FMN oxidoreductase RutF